MKNSAAVKPHCLLVLISFNQLHYTKQCIESIYKNTTIPFHLLVVDNGSNQETIKYLKEQEGLNKCTAIFNQKNKGWIGAVNQGLFYGKYDYYCVMNNDLIMYPNWLSEMMEVVKSNKDAGLVNPEWNIPKKFKSNHEQFYTKVISKRKQNSIQTDWTRGFCFLIDRKVIEAIGGFDDYYREGYYEDWDYSIRATQAGFQCYRALKAFVYHYINITFDSIYYKSSDYNEIFYGNEKLFLKRWGRPLRILLSFQASKKITSTTQLSLIQQLLNEQNVITYIKNENHPDCQHTNCHLKSCSNLTYYIQLLSCLVDNIRHSEKKRFDLLLVPAKIASLLQSLPWITKAYTIINIDEISNKDLSCKLSELKKVL